MKKNLFLLMQILLVTLCYGQNRPDGVKFIKKIVSTELLNNDTINHRVVYTYFDSLKNVLSNENTLSSALEKGSKSITVTNTPQKYVQADITPEGDTLDLIIYLYNEKKQRTHYFQIRQGDTLTAQKRTYDNKGNNTELYNKFKDKGEYYLRMEWKYDDKNNITEHKTYDENRQLIQLEKYENKYSKDGVNMTTTMYRYVNGNGFVKRYKSIREGNKKTTYNYYSQTGYNYGIEMRTVEGGYKIEEYDEEENLKSLEIYDNYNKLTTSVYIFWETIK